MSLTAVSKFKFVSPGIFIDEIDQSHLPAEPSKMGPILVGRAQRGPGMRPVTVNSFSEFVEIFGNPVPGGKLSDSWRDGNLSAPTYAVYAAQAYLANSNPITFVRLLGSQHKSAESAGKAGWQTDSLEAASTNGGSLTGIGGAFGLFVIPSGTLSPKAQLVDAIDTTGAANDNDFNIVVPTGAGGDGVTHNIIIKSTSQTAEAVNDATGYAIVNAGTVAELAARIADAINQVAHANVVFGTGNVNSTGPDLGVTATVDDTKVTLEVDQRGIAGNVALLTQGDAGFAGALLKEGEAAGIVTEGTQAALTGTLAAVFYVNEGAAVLTGTLRGTGKDNSALGATAQFTSGTAVLVQSLESGDTGINNEFKVAVFDGSDNKVTETAFNFNRASDKYIRKVFNTNPQLTNSTIYTTAEGKTNYWLGETFERAVADRLSTSGSAGNFGVMLCLSSGSHSYASMRKEYYPSQTGFIISQDENADPAGFDAGDTTRAKKLFKFVSIDGGSEWNQNSLKISIENIKPAVSSKAWPTFSVTVRDIADSDKRPIVIERFSNVNLDPSSPDYIARRIGDRSITYDHTDKRNKLLGEYENQSRWIRVAMEPGNAQAHVPFGCYGPVKFNDFSITSGSVVDGNSAIPSFVECDSSKIPATAWKTSADVKLNYFQNKVIVAANASNAILQSEVDFNCVFEFPEVPLRVSASTDGIINPLKAYWGVDTSEKDTAQFEKSMKDVLRSKPLQDNTTFDNSSLLNSGYSWVFTLDDLRYDETAQTWTYDSGSRQRGAASLSTAQHLSVLSSFTARSGSYHLLTGSNAGMNKFTTVLYGGFDGLDVTEREPFRNTFVKGGALEGASNYGYHTLMRAVDLVEDAEVVEANLMSIPGCTVPAITNRLVDVCAERADALAVIDIENDYVPDTEVNLNTSETDRIGNVDQAVRNMKDREIDSSYGCAYYPWVQIKDSTDGAAVWVPPSVVALGAMAYTENRKDVWFAPAGFARGGLTETKAGGQNVLSARQQLTSKQRDKLYEANVNPIATFPAEGLVIFGQKTLQTARSALDRINVRRLLIFLKKEVSRIANRTLFEQNVQETWNAFSGEVDLLLNTVQTRFGLTDYRLKLDETTTTPELIDRNILYAKIYLKPARAIEFIALDFIITSSGAAFED